MLHESGDGEGRHDQPEERADERPGPDDPGGVAADLPGGWEEDIEQIKELLTGEGSEEGAKS